MKTQKELIDILRELYPIGRTVTEDCSICHTFKSIKVNESKKIYHCFNCGDGGDIITFFMTHYNLSGKEAKQMFIGTFCGWLCEIFKVDEVDDAELSQIRRTFRQAMFKIKNKMTEVEAMEKLNA